MHSSKKMFVFNSKSCNLSSDYQNYISFKDIADWCQIVARLESDLFNQCATPPSPSQQKLLDSNCVPLDYCKISRGAQKHLSTLDFALGILSAYFVCQKCGKLLEYCISSPSPFSFQCKWCYIFPVMIIVVKLSIYQS